MEQSLKSKSQKGIIWASIEQYSIQGVQFIVGIILARILSPSEFGVIGMVTVFLALSQTFVDSGFSNALIRKIDRSQTDFSTVFYFNIVISLFIYLLLFVSSPYIADFYNLPILSPLTKILGLNVILNSLMVIQRTVLSINIDFKSQAKTSTIAAIISGIFGIVLAYHGWGVWALAYMSILGTIVNVILLWFISTWRPSWVFSWASFHKLFSFGSKLLASGLLHTFYLQLSTILIGKFFSAQALGFYTRAERLAGMPLNNITLILQKVTFPILSTLQDDAKRLIEIYRKYLKFSSLIIFFAIFFLASVAKPTVLMLIGAKWTDSILLFQLLCFAFLMDHIFSINLNLLQVKGRSDLFLRLEIIKKTISITLIVVFLKFYGVIGICIAKIIYSQIATVINTYYTHKLFGYSYFQQMKDILLFLILSIIVTIPGYFIAETGTIYIVQILLSLFISLGSYMLVLYLMKEESFLYLASIVINKVKRK
jgi:O-antigen/teichoic acid export membrane protein